MSDAAAAYRTVAGRGEAAFEVQGSRFFGHVATADSVDAAEAFVERVAAEYADATHNVPAYRIRAAPLREYANDDGEPGGSAGKPALTVLKREELENVVAVVTRYYGGTNLGIGGLSRAYGRAVKLAIDDAGVVTEQPHETVSIVVEYDDSGTVRGIIEGAAVEFEATYGERVGFQVRMPVTERDAFCERVLSATSGRATIDAEDEAQSGSRTNED
jgi:uncharacterized YigZ family protein